MITELLTGVERNQYSAGGGIRAEHDRRAGPARRFDLEQVPTLHNAILELIEALVRLKRP